MSYNDTPLCINGIELHSRLFIGTGKFASTDLMCAALAAAQAQVVTVALRRVDLSAPNDALLNAIDPQKYIIMPNTSGARNAQEAVRLAHLARAAGCGTWIKLEVTPDPRHLLPDPIETLTAAQQLVADGFTVLPYINADPVLAKRLEDVGTATVMPLAAPIGTNKGMRTRDALEMIIAHATVPVVVDAGLGAPSHAAEAMEMGADAVLVNTAIAVAEDPALMAAAFCTAVRAGRMAYRAGLPAMCDTPDASSPLTGFLHTGGS